MSDYNHINIVGRPTEDAEVKTIQKNGKPFSVATFTIAQTIKKSSVKDHTNYIKCELFNSRAEKIGPFIKKGERLMVTGQLIIETVENESDGKKSYSNFISVNAKEIVFLSTKKNINIK
jgi:single-strand DNA-binding protein